MNISRIKSHRQNMQTQSVDYLVQWQGSSEAYWWDFRDLAEYLEQLLEFEENLDDKDIKSAASSNSGLDSDLSYSFKGGEKGERGGFGKRWKRIRRVSGSEEEEGKDKKEIVKQETEENANSETQTQKGKVMCEYESNQLDLPIEELAAEEQQSHPHQRQPSQLYPDHTANTQKIPSPSGKRQLRSSSDEEEFGETKQVKKQCG